MKVRINQNAPVVCSSRMTTHADLSKVWSVLTDIDRWSSWNTGISYAKLNGTLNAKSVFVWKTGVIKIHSTLHTVEPFKDFGWTGEVLGAFAVHNWHLAEANGHTTVWVEESMEGILVKLFRKSFRKKLEVQMQQWLDLLKRECESGLS